MLELVQQHHPHMGEVEVRKILNRSMDLISALTDIVKTMFYTTTTSGKRYYDLDNDILKVYDVTLSDGSGEDYHIGRLAGGMPSKEDST